MMLHVSAASRSLKKGTIYIAIWDGCHRVVTPQAFSELLNTAIIMSVYQVTTADGAQL